MLLTFFMEAVSITSTAPGATAIATNVGISDTFPPSLTSCSWTCSASSGGACQSASGSGNIATTTNSIAANGGTVTFSATCTVDAATTAPVTNTATLSYVNDTNAANNTASDTDTIVPQADLSIADSDGISTLAAGSNTTYTITVTNPATVAVGNVAVTDTFPATLGSCAWTCTASSGGNCQTANASGDIATTANSIAASNGTLTFSASLRSTCATSGLWC